MFGKFYGENELYCDILLVFFRFIWKKEIDINKEEKIDLMIYKK